MTILSKPGDPLLTICAWCPDHDKTDPRNATASHGICASCLSREFGDDNVTRSVEPVKASAHIHAATDTRGF